MLSANGKRNRSRALHPARRRNVSAPVLIIAADEASRTELELVLHPPISVRSVAGAPDTEGRGVCVVVIGGAFPMAELVEVRAHPELFDRPVVLFAPGRRLPDSDWSALGVELITTEPGATRQLVNTVRRLLDDADRSTSDEAVG